MNSITELKNISKIKIKSKIPECRTTNQNSQVLKENQRNGLPFFAINAKRMYGNIEYDFVNIDYDLNNEGCSKVGQIYNEMENQSELYDYYLPQRNLGNVMGVSLEVELDLCREYAPHVRDIIFNQEYWQPCYGLQLLEAYEKEIQRS